MIVLNKFAGFVSRYFVLEIRRRGFAAAAAAGGVTADILGFRGLWYGLGDFVELEIAVGAVELDFGDGGFAERGALSFHEFDDFHGGFEAGGSGGFTVAEYLSKSVECEAGEVSEFVQETIGSVVAGGEGDTGEAGVFLGPEVDGGAVNGSLFSSERPAGAAAEMDWSATRACNTCC